MGLMAVFTFHPSIYLLVFFQYLRPRFLSVLCCQVIYFDPVWSCMKHLFRKNCKLGHGRNCLQEKGQEDAHRKLKGFKDI